MGIFKTLGYVSAGMLAVTLGPGTAALAATYAAGGAAMRHLKNREQTAYDNGVAEGAKAGEAVAKSEYEQRLSELVERLSQYHDADEKLVALYAVGLAVANADGEISDEELASLEAFVSGCMASHLPAAVKRQIEQLQVNPPKFQRAMNIAKAAGLPRQDIDDVVMLVALADGVIVPEEEKFIARWKKMAATMTDADMMAA